MTRTVALLALALLAAQLHANLLEKTCPGKTEAQLATDFEAGIGAFLDKRLKEPVKPRISVVQGKATVQLELVSLKDDTGTWQELVQYAWFKETSLYAMKPYGKTFTYKHLDIAPTQLALLYEPKYRLPADIVTAAVWVASKGDLDAANQLLAGLAAVKPELRPDVEAWLCARNSWTAPLVDYATHDLATQADVFRLLPKAQVDERLKLLDKEAKEAFKELETQQGGDIKSKPGARKKPPTLRLEILVSRCERFGKAFAGTPYVANKKNMEKVEKLIEVIKADLEFVENEGFKADRLGIENKLGECAQAWDNLLRIDPLNPDLITKTAEAWAKAAEITDGGKKAVNPKAALRAGTLYEEVLAIFPAALGFHNHAGLTLMAGGESKRAKEHFEEVIRRTDNRTDLAENEKSNREFAERQLKLLK